MAHDIQLSRTGKAQIAFIGDTPWHGLGQSLTKGATMKTWAEEADLNWSALACPVSYMVAGNNRVSAGHKGLVRSDTKELLSIVGADYKVVQPLEVLEFFRNMVEGGGWFIHTAGLIKGGRKVWAMASKDNGAVSVKGAKDLVMPNLLLATSLDGSMRTIAKNTCVRVVCANTIAMALNSSGKQVTVSHRSVFDANEVQKQLGIADDAFDVFMKQARQLADCSMDVSKAREVLNSIFLPKKAAVKVDMSWMHTIGAKPIMAEDQMADTRAVARCLELYQGEGMGANLATAKGTAWGLLNAVTQMVDHDMGRTQDNRLDAAWFGRGDGFKSQALQKLLALTV